MNTAPALAAVVQAFKERYAAAPSFVVRAPGRVNLIGEHTDYNDGFVLPLAIDRAVWIALRPARHRHVRVVSLEYGEECEFDFSDDQPRENEWIEYMRGVAWALLNSGCELTGWEAVMTSEVPIGAGLSSSAALELATARAFAAVSAIPWEPRRMALLAQRAENEWVGVNCGIMDQMISAAGAAGHALLIDCRSLEFRAVRLPAETAVVIMDTATRRGLVDSAYNERRASCELAAQLLGVTALRDVDLSTFEARAAGMNELVRKRARHVISENERTLAAAEALQQNDAVSAGALMNASHVSLRDEFEVSRAELDTVVNIAQRHDACFGARMTGAGFGGCAVALVQRSAADSFAASVARDYAAATGLQPKVYVCSASAGASVIADGAS